MLGEAQPSGWDSPQGQNGTCYQKWLRTTGLRSCGTEFQTEKQLPKNQPDRVVVHREQNTRTEHHSVIDVAVPGDSNIRKKAHKEIVLGS